MSARDRPMKRWHYICATSNGVTTITTEVVVTQRAASDLVREHVKGVAGLRVEADSKLSYARHAGEAVKLTEHSRLEYREVA